MFFVVEKTFSASQKRFSEAETIFFESEKGFCITQKIVGEAYPRKQPQLFGLFGNRRHSYL
jgi:hypothetical protein